MHFVYSCCVSNDSYCIFNMGVNGASQIFSLTPSAIKGLHGHILPKRNYWPSLLIKRKVTGSLPHPTNEHQGSINNIWSCILDNHRAVQRH